MCDAHVPVLKDSEVSEMLSCPECKGRLVVESISEKHVALSKAPDIEEDWGE
ncbi:lysine biosynthesis protein LysW [Candidatus Gottesmanbacteria bacterium]|nr:lysine biosynthesis protein LysW [Candidatus Gottesmanbacteria bacterium]